LSGAPEASRKDFVSLFQQFAGAFWVVSILFRMLDQNCSKPVAPGNIPEAAIIAILGSSFMKSRLLPDMTLKFKAYSRGAMISQVQSQVKKRTKNMKEINAETRSVA